MRYAEVRTPEVRTQVREQFEAEQMANIHGCLRKLPCGHRCGLWQRSEPLRCSPFNTDRQVCRCEGY